MRWHARRGADALVENTVERPEPYWYGAYPELLVLSADGGVARDAGKRRRNPATGVHCVGVR